MLLSSHKTYGTDVEASSDLMSNASEDRHSTYPKSDLICSQEVFTKEEIDQQITNVKRLAMLTVLATCALSILSFISSEDSDSSAAFSFAFDSFLAGLTSIIIMWRFSSSKELENRNRKRELIALLIITISLLVTGALIAYRAIKALVCEDKHEKSTMLLIVSSVSVAFYIVLFILKYRLAKRLGSRALRADSMDALCGAILALSIAITTSTREFTAKAWFLDSVVALGVALFSLVYGTYSVLQLVKLYKEYRELMKERELTPSDIVYQPHA